MLSSRKTRKVDGRLMQRANRALVLNLVRADPTLSRAAIARETGLSPAAVSGIVDHLLREGLVREEPALATGQVGRPALQLRVVPAARLALGIALDVQEIMAGLVDLGGTVRAVSRAPIGPDPRPDAVLDMVASLARRALAAAGMTPVIGVGMAVPGMVRWPDGLNLFSPNLGWRGVPLRTMIEERLDRPVLVDNEVRAVALAESHFGAARKAHTAVFLDAGYGVGGAAIVDGALYRGVRGGAVEVGHNTVEAGGPLCSCGNRGCLEVFASTHGIAARAHEALAAGRPSSLAQLPTGRLTFDAVVAAAMAGDALARELVSRAAAYLGIAAAGLVNAWDPELVVLSGPVVRAGAGMFSDLLAAERSTVIETGRVAVPIVTAAHEADAKIVGAATLAIAEYLAVPLPLDERNARRSNGAAHA